MQIASKGFRMVETSPKNFSSVPTAIIARKMSGVFGSESLCRINRTTDGRAIEEISVEQRMANRLVLETGFDPQIKNQNSETLIKAAVDEGVVELAELEPEALGKTMNEIFAGSPSNFRTCAYLFSSAKLMLTPFRTIGDPVSVLEAQNDASRTAELGKELYENDLTSLAGRIFLKKEDIVQPTANVVPGLTFNIFLDDAFSSMIDQVALFQVVGMTAHIRLQEAARQAGFNTIWTGGNFAPYMTNERGNFFTWLKVAPVKS